MSVKAAKRAAENIETSPEAVPNAANHDHIQNKAIYDKFINETKALFDTGKVSFESRGGLLIEEKSKKEEKPVSQLSLLLDFEEMGHQEEEPMRRFGRNSDIELI